LFTIVRICGDGELNKSFRSNNTQNTHAILIFYVYRVLDQHKLSKEQWEERIQIWHEEHRGILK